MNILLQFESMGDGHFGHSTMARLQIELLQPDTAPVNLAPNQAGPKMCEFEKAGTDKMLAWNVIEPARTELATSIVLVPDKDGSLQSRVFYWKFNALAKWDSYLIPHIDKYLVSVGNATVFSKLIANSRYWQVQINDGDKDSTEFTSQNSLYHFERMPFGLRNAPRIFLATMDKILCSVKWHFALV